MKKHTALHIIPVSPPNLNMLITYWLVYIIYFKVLQKVHAQNKWETWHKVSGLVNVLITDTLRALKVDG